VTVFCYIFGEKCGLAPAWPKQDVFRIIPSRLFIAGFCRTGCRHQRDSRRYLAGQFMEYDLGYFDLETRMLEPLENPFGPKVM